MTEKDTKQPPLYDKLKVEPDRYVPTGDFVSYGGDNPHAHLLPIKKIYEVNVDANYPYVDNSLRFRILNWLYYFQSKTLIVFLNKFRYGFKMRGQENIKNNMNK